MNIYELRDKVISNSNGQEIIDYNQLKYVLKDYVHPRGKISGWLKTGELIRVKKGLYIFGPSIAKAPFSFEVLANLIYGPSAISLNYALAYYGLIPESVHTITSITTKRNKIFNTPISQFTYRYLSKEKYSVGIQLTSINNKVNFLIASPEKALCDVIALTIKNMNFDSIEDIKGFLLDDLRIDEDALGELNLDLIDEINNRYCNIKLNQFTKYFKDWMK